MEWARKATGSAVVVTRGDGTVLLLRRAYPPHDWVLPGGNAEAGESPTDTALRETREETGLDVELQRLTGVHYQADHRAGEFIHFVFRAPMPDGDLQPDAEEVADWGVLFAELASGADEPFDPLTAARRSRRPITPPADHAPTATGVTSAIRAQCRPRGWGYLSS
ncbi:MAG TPA: NUDIX hydrolase [Candidatus Limnocylindria bacterium]